MNRYVFTEAKINKAKSFLNGTTKTAPSFVKKFKATVKEGKLLLDGKRVIPKEKVDTYLRTVVLSGKVPLARDSLFYYLTRSIVGVSREAIQKFLKSQNIIRETDNRQNKIKAASRAVRKKGQLSYDLIEINWNDLGFTPTDKDIEKESGYIFACVDALTSLSFFEFANTKAYKDITPVAEKSFKWFAKHLQLPINRLVGFSDDGVEFNFKLYNSWGIRTKILKRSNIIEAKNAHFQRVLYRIAKMQNTRSIKKLVKDAMGILNKTQSSLTKKAPVENIKEPVETLQKKYNKKRGKDSGGKVKLKPLKIGDKVRVDLIGPKQTSFYKTYKGKTWSKKTFTVLAKRGPKYKIDLGNEKKFFQRNELRLTSPTDRTTSKILAQRRINRFSKAKQEAAAAQKKRQEEGQKSGKRKAFLKASQKLAKHYSQERADEI